MKAGLFSGEEGRHEFIWRARAFILLLLLAVSLFNLHCQGESDCNCDCGAAGCRNRGRAISYQEEAKRNLDEIFTCEISYYGEMNTFSDSFEMINWGPGGETRYAYFLPAGVFQPTFTEPYSLPPDIRSAANLDSFTAVAVGNIDCDSTLDVWTINEHKMLINVINDLEK